MSRRAGGQPSAKIDRSNVALAANGGGAQVQGVERNSPAARAGLRQGDVLVALNGERMETSRTLIRSDPAWNTPDAVTALV